MRECCRKVRNPSGISSPSQQMAKHFTRQQEARKQAELGFLCTLNDDVKSADDVIDADVNEDSTTQKRKQGEANKAESFFDDLNSAAPGDDAGRKQFDNIIKYAKRKATECVSEPNKVLSDRIAHARKRLIVSAVENKLIFKNSTRINSRADNSGDEPDDRILIKEQIRKRAGKKAVTEAVHVVGAVEDGGVVVDTSSFKGMGLARSLLKAVSQLGFASPTPVQAATIPIALTGRDICACAATGTGKTAAYMLPILERIVHNLTVEKSNETKENAGEERTTRVLILVPTRELAVQVFTVAEKMAAHAGEGLSVALAAGGMDIKRQAVVLQTRPTIVIATPGRLLDHAKASVVTNSTNNAEQQKYAFSVQQVEILVLDEADRMLDESFEEQIKEILKLLPPIASRQTMLFSATMSEDVLALSRTLLNNPQQIICNEEAVMSAPNLHQEYVRVRQETSREALLVALVMRHFSTKTLVFVATKVEAHRLHIILGLLGCSVGELHGNLSQAQRLDTLQRFREEREMDVLVATDVAARGLDIPQVQTIINYRMPRTLKSYIHRVGRTARAGRAGRSVSLVGEAERKLLRQVVQASKEPLTSRSIPPEVVGKYREKLVTLDVLLNEILHAEHPQNSDAGEANAEKNAKSNILANSDETAEVNDDDTENLSKQKVGKKSRQVEQKPKHVPLFKKKLTRKMKRRAEVLDKTGDQQSGKAPPGKVLLKKAERFSGDKNQNRFAGRHVADSRKSEKKRQKSKTAASAFGVDLSRGKQKVY